MTLRLPPGQRAISGFPRFGKDLKNPPPPIPADPVIELGGVLTEGVALSVAELGKLPRREVRADFHCVAGWSATGLVWEGVAFKDFYRVLVEPRLRPGAVVSHLVFVGSDGMRALVLLEDALGEDVLVAERLGGEPLTGDHGAPVRLVSPWQYGYVNIKHLCRIEFHATEPRATDPWSPLAAHARARVWKEERHRRLPGRVVRPLYRGVVVVIRALSAKGGSARQG
ncbi:sulfite oxidase-like oxidoreductase [Streptomyces longisporoflavus]|uniref:molybdopterin-dependent oxidoreductase n=1 Tax=Streptomyces longisporoflavus TaxID=28044 RepID=UPI00167CEAFF|nr:molybdopterin-dependent oxidoreductase [Streptomyces longisporoflavus]GGV65915.1 sulfite oxidase-like oxidoreductase [Streptomyces longisporoflavus]